MGKYNKKATEILCTDRFKKNKVNYPRFYTKIPVCVCIFFFSKKKIYAKNSGSFFLLLLSFTPAFFFFFKDAYDALWTLGSDTDFFFFSLSRCFPHFLHSPQLFNTFNFLGELSTEKA